jgi:hypothetical protein
MPRASETQKAGRLNRARDLLLHVDRLSDEVEQLAQDCSISPRQAYRYLEQAQRLKQPAGPAKRSQTGIHRQTSEQPGPAWPHVCCSHLLQPKDCPSARLSAECCSRCCREGEGVGEPKPIRQGAEGTDLFFACI